MSGSPRDQCRRSHAEWPAVCDCGATKYVRGSKLLAGLAISCGSWRADPAVRQAARLRTSPRRRKQIARNGSAGPLDRL